MSFYQEARSLRNLNGVHPALVAVVNRAVEGMNEQVLVVEGLRTIAQQRKYVNTGKSKTMNSRHLTGHAVDLVIVEPDRPRGKKARWGKPHSTRLADAMQAAADELGVEIDRGYDWGWDAPHFQLDWKAFPKQDMDWKRPSVAETVVKPVKKAPVSAVGAPVAAGVALYWQSFLDGVTGVAAWMQAVAVEFGSLGPIKSILAETGANVAALTVGGLILAAGIVVKKATEEDD